MRKEQSVWDERQELGMPFEGLLPRFAKEFEETRTLLLQPVVNREHWISGLSVDSLVRTFEDLLTAAGVTTYRNGSIAFLGAYMSLYDFTAANVVVAELTNGELRALKEYYEHSRYLSPIYGLVASSCRDELSRREKASAAKNQDAPATARSEEREQAVSA